jgi:hypothetical protein
VAADINGDGAKEIIAANFGDGTLIGQDNTKPPASSISIFTRSGKNSFTETKVIAGNGPRGLAAGDLNGDGRDEFVVSNYEDGNIMIFEGGLLTTTLDAGKHPVGVDIGDIDGDGKKDIAVAVYSDNKVVVFLNRGKSWVKKELTISGSPTDVSIGRLGTDTVILAADYTAGNVSVIKYSADSLVKASDITTGGGTCKVELADVTGDGHPDIVTANFYDNTVSVIPVDAAGNLGQIAVYPTGGKMPNGIAIADVNGDKLNDIITANRDDDTISVLIQKDGKLLPAKVIQVTNDDVKTFGPVEVAAADLNSDGLADIAFTHMRSNTVRVIYQTLPASPVITSSTHPDEKSWYPEKTAQLNLSADDMSGVGGYYWAVTKDDAALDISKAAFSATGVVTAENLDSGTNYFRAVTKDSNGNLSAASVLKINVAEDMSEKNVYNYPNPCSTATTIKFMVLSKQAVKIIIKDINSMPVWHKDLSEAEVSAGANMVEWNLDNDAGRAVNNGVYIFSVVTKEKTVSKKIVVVK